MNRGYNFLSICINVVQQLVNEMNSDCPIYPRSLTLLISPLLIITSSSQFKRKRSVTVQFNTNLTNFDLAHAWHPQLYTMFRVVCDMLICM
jgi:hypothetical protein